MLEDSPQEQVLLNKDLLNLVFSWLSEDGKAQAKLSAVCKAANDVYKKNNNHLKNEIKHFLNLKNENLEGLSDIVGVHKRITIIKDALCLQSKISESTSKSPFFRGFVKEFVDDFFECLIGLLGRDEWRSIIILKYLDSSEFFEKNMPTTNMELATLQNSQAIAAMLCNAELVNYLLDKEEQYYPDKTQRQSESQKKWVASIFRKFNCISGIEEEDKKKRVSFKELLFSACLIGDKNLFIRIFKKYGHQMASIDRNCLKQFYDYMLSYTIRSKSLDLVIYMEQTLKLAVKTIQSSAGTILLKHGFIECDEISRHYELDSIDPSNETLASLAKY